VRQYHRLLPLDESGPVFPDRPAGSEILLIDLHRPALHLGDDLGRTEVVPFPHALHLFERPGEVIGCGAGLE
jgi:hypothetical protein